MLIPATLPCAPLPVARLMAARLAGTTSPSEAPSTTMAAIISGCVGASVSPRSPAKAPVPPTTSMRIGGQRRRGVRIACDRNMAAAAAVIEAPANPTAAA